jgi:hypothetical protein
VFWGLIEQGSFFLIQGFFLRFALPFRGGDDYISLGEGNDPPEIASPEAPLTLGAKGLFGRRRGLRPEGFTTSLTLYWHKNNRNLSGGISACPKS